MTIVKICGITRPEDAQVAIEAGAQMLGFNFYPKSPRCITPQTCRAITDVIRQQAPEVKLVGVSVNAGLEEIESTLKTAGLDLAQLHGDEPPELLAKLGKRAFKAIRLSKEYSTDFLDEQFTKNEPALLVDAAVKGAYGGTGQVADWVAASRLARRFPLLLAGGLTPDNVAAAVRQVEPWGVDVASGVETSPGLKDTQKVRAFVQAVKEMDARSQALPIEAASREELSNILALQKLAYQSEAALNNDYSIPPLTQTEAGIAADFERMIYLKAERDGRIIGSVRAYLDEKGACQIGRVIVDPECQNQGLGTRLLNAIEKQFPQAACYELFTSQRSQRNLYLYRKLGYKETRQEKLNEKTTLIYLTKEGTA